MLLGVARLKKLCPVFIRIRLRENPTRSLLNLPSVKAMAVQNFAMRLCQIIRQYQLDATLVKSYATDFCGVKALREATREQVENFVCHLADWADKDRNALLCQLNSYPRQKEGAA